MKISVVISGRSYHTSADLPAELTLHPEATLTDALSTLRQSTSNGSTLPDSCLVAVSGRHVGTLAAHTAVPLREGDELVLIAPVAGG